VSFFCAKFLISQKSINLLNININIKIDMENKIKSAIIRRMSINIPAGRVIVSLTNRGLLHYNIPAGFGGGEALQEFKKKYSKQIEDFKNNL